MSSWFLSIYFFPSWLILSSILSCKCAYLLRGYFVLIFLFFLIEAQLIYKVVLVSRVQQNDSDIHIYILFQILSIIDYYKVVSTVPCVIE